MSKVKLTTNHGAITIELDAAKAPATVENFLAYVRSGTTTNTIFHRVIDGFMIQGGGFEPGMRQKPTQAPIKNEAQNGLKNDRYTIAMARTSDPHSATAQFFINVEGQRLSQPHRAESTGLGLLRLRQGDRGHGRRRQDQGREDRHAGNAPGCAGGRRGDSEGGGGLNGGEG